MREFPLAKGHNAKTFSLADGPIEIDDDENKCVALSNAAFNDNVICEP